MFRFAATAIVALTVFPLMAQTQPGAGGLAGQVFCSDTQKPARFATVTLTPDMAESNGAGGLRGSTSASGSTAADGSFTIKEIPAGVYNVQIVMPGYVQPVRQLNLLGDSDSEIRQQLLKMLTKVKIDAGQTANATVTAYRGADLSGSVEYDDGTPAAGITVSALLALPVVGGDASNTAAASAANVNLRPVGSSAQTDDRGRFHLSGLADGDYTVQALPRGGVLFPVYFGNTVDRSKAKLIAAKSGEERSSLDLLLDIAGLHRVHGLLVGPDNHALPHVNVTLTLSNAQRSLSVLTAADGSFTFSAVPDGSFTLSANGAFDPDTRVIYKGASTQITVAGSDISDVVLSLTQ